MTEHYRDDTYQHLDGGRVLVACTCGWRSEPITPERISEHLLTDDAHEDLDELWRRHIAPLVEPDPGQVLMLSEDEGGPRWFLAGESLSAGTSIELLMPGGVWLRGRLEFKHATPDPFGHDRTPLPVFYTTVGGPADDNRALEYIQQVHFPLPPRAVLRRP